MNVAIVGFLLGGLVLAGAGGGDSQLAPGRSQIVISAPSPVVLGEPLGVKLRSLTPGTPYHLTTEYTNVWGVKYRSKNTYVADSTGTVDLSSDAPLNGSYAGADRLGIFWSAARDGPALPIGPLDLPSDFVEVSLTLERNDAVLDRQTLVLWEVRPGVRHCEIRDGGVVAALYEPASQDAPRPLVVLLGGSGGGMTWQREIAGILASHGYVALALAYFNGDGLPRSLSEIPLEYFRDAIRVARDFSSVDAKHIAVLGLSRGAEAALLAASEFPEITAVVAFSPSFVSFMGQRPPDYPLIASWTLEGKPLSYVPTREIRPYDGSDNEAERHMRYLIVNSDTVQAATIPVERINGPILLFSGGDDPIWPSRLMAELITRRLSMKHFAHPYYQYDFARAGHVFARPGYQSTVPGGFSGGDPHANAYAQVESTRRVLEFLDTWRREPK